MTTPCDLISVLVVDDRLIARLAAREILRQSTRYRWVGEASSGTEALHLVSRLNPRLVLLDVEMPEMSGAATARALLKLSPDVRIVAWTVSDADEDLLSMAEAGCTNYVLKDQGPDVMERAFDAAMQGLGSLPDSMIASLLRRAARAVPKGALAQSPLTAREIQVLTATAQGLNRKQVAKLLSVEPSTVAWYFREIYRKLGVNTQAAATARAMQLGLIPSA